MAEATIEAKEVKYRMGVRDKARRKKAGTMLVEVSHQHGKPKYIEIKKKLTVAAIAKASGFTDEVKKTPKEVGLRLNTKKCKWTDIVNKDDSFIYFVPHMEGGRGN